jgi:hypothetical protein
MQRSSTLALSGLLLLGCIAPSSLATSRLDSQSRQSPPSSPTVVAVGAYLSNVPKVSLKENAFSFEMFLWFRWDPERWPPAGLGQSADSAIGPAGQFEIVNGFGVRRQIVAEEPGYVCLQVSGQATRMWDIRNFPFDEQMLRIEIEDSTYESDLVRYEPDRADSIRNPDLKIPGFEIGSLSIGATDHRYHTAYGDPTPTGGSASSDYSRVSIDLPIGRLGWGRFLKLFTATFVATGIAVLSLGIRGSMAAPRISVCVGALFAVVGSGYVIGNLLPDGSDLVFADKVQIAGMATVFIAMLQAVVSMRMHASESPGTAALADRIDRVLLVGLPIAFVISVTLLVRSAVAA